MTSRDRQDVCLTKKVAFLRRSGSYPLRTRAVVAIETHFSWVFLAGGRAYKLKKPVHRRPMDYRSIASRKRSCQREVALNRRLAPDVYLDVVPLSQTAAGALKLGPGGTVVDWLVVMRRLPAERMLDRALTRGRVRPSHVQAVIGRLAGFYAAAAPVRMTGVRYLARLRRRTLENRRELLEPSLELDRALVARICAAQLRYLRASSDEIRSRAARIVDGHGDLRPEHVYLGPPVAIIDCLEFARDLRVLDPLEEIAFLALECARLGTPLVARSLIDGFRKVSGDAPDALVDFYLSQRATNRAKIAAWHLHDPQIHDRSRWIERAHSYLYGALHHAEAALAPIRRRRFGRVRAAVHETRLRDARAAP